MNGIQLAARLYEARDEARLRLGDRYAATMAKGAEYIRAVMAKHGCTELAAALKLGKEVRDDADALMIILASVVEMVEPSTKAGTAMGGNG